MLRPVNEQDVARLYREYGYLVFRRCVVYLGDVTAAREVTRDVFVRALRNPTSFRAFADPRTWLCRVADTLCIDRLRRGHKAASSDDAALASAIADDDLESLLLVRRLLGNLEPDALRLAVLFYVDELTEEELGQELGLSRRTVAKRVAELLEHARGLAFQRNAS
jgi:RNA polymerase sigma-70 factor (ECF subfamily)